MMPIAYVEGHGPTCSCCHVTDPDAWRARDAELAAAYTGPGYPVGWPVSLRPALDAVRELLAEGRTPLAHGSWNWHRKGSASCPARTFVLEYRGERWEGPDTDLPALLGTLSPAWRDRTAAPGPRRIPRPRREAPAPVEETVMSTPVVEVPAIAGVPSDALGDYLARLIHEPKRIYARAYVAHVLNGAACPPDPGTDWALKVRVKVAKLAKRAEVAA